MDVKNDVFACITEPSNDDYDNDVSDNCDNNFGTFDDFGFKNDQKVSHNMILMSKYKEQHGGKKGKQIRARPSPPPFRAMPERNRFFLIRDVPLLDPLFAQFLVLLLLGWDQLHLSSTTSFNESNNKFAEDQLKKSF